MNSPLENMSKILDFTQEFDGTQPELTEDEKLEAATLFKSGVQDVFLKHIDRVKRINGKVHLYPYDFAALRLKTFFEDRTRLDFEVMSFDTQTACPYRVDVSENQSFNKTYRHSRYMLDPTEEEVRRYDMHHEPINFTGYKQPISGLYSTLYLEEVPRPDPEKIREAFKEMGNIWEDEFKRRAVERQLGFNDQPIGPDEARVLLSLIEQAEPEF